MQEVTECVVILVKVDVEFVVQAPELIDGFDRALLLLLDEIGQ